MQFTLGVYLTDLTFLEIGNPDYLPDTHFINFEKRRRVYNLIREIQKYMEVPYAFIPIGQIQEFIKKIYEKRGSPRGWEESPSMMTEDELYERSLIVEPNEDTDSDEDR